MVGSERGELAEMLRCRTGVMLRRGGGLVRKLDLSQAMRAVAVTGRGASGWWSAERRGGKWPGAGAWSRTREGAGVAGAVLELGAGSMARVSRSAKRGRGGLIGGEAVWTSGQRAGFSRYMGRL
jgi:hypothetical protein